MSVYTVLHSTAHLDIIVNKAILLSNKYIYHIFIAVVPCSIRTHATDRPDRQSDLRHEYQSKIFLISFLILNYLNVMMYQL